MLHILMFVGLVLAGAPAMAGQDLVVVQSQLGAVETLDRLEAIVKKNGLTVFARIDHAGGAKSVGVAMKPNQMLLFGSPKLGTPLLVSNPRIGIDLPIRVLAWEDADGASWVAYTDPQVLKNRYGIGDRDKVFAKMAGALAKMTGIASKK
ncbi:MAG: DUF302 domain-containing protein [Alphaproteobacteria bacterium]